MKVNLVHRKNAKQTTLYLYYTVDKIQKREKLDLFYTDAMDSKEVARIMQLAEAVRASRQNEVNYSAVGLYNKARLQKLFTEHCNDFIDLLESKPERERTKYMMNHLVKFSGDHISFAMVNERFCIRFRTFLKSNLLPETAHGYFRMFKKALRQAVKDEIIQKNPAEFVENIEKGDPMIKKNTLDPDELELLRKTPCPDDVIYRASMIAIATGMGAAEINTLYAKHVNVKRMELTYYRQKNKNKPIRSITVPIHEETLKMLGDLSVPDKKLFVLPNRTWYNKVIARWVLSAGITKHISFYCFRHSCIQILLNLETPLSTIKEIVGHKDYRLLDRYAKPSDELKRNAIKGLSG